MASAPNADGAWLQLFAKAGAELLVIGQAHRSGVDARIDVITDKQNGN